jgi:hypothetical protein
VVEYAFRDCCCRSLVVPGDNVERKNSWFGSADISVGEAFRSAGVSARTTIEACRRPNGASDRAAENLRKQFQTYKAEVAAKGSNASPAKVDAAIVRVANSNTIVRLSLLGQLKELEEVGFTPVIIDTTEKPR